METTNYMIFGFAVIFGVLGLHLASMYVRHRNLRRDWTLLEQLERRSAGKVRKKRKISRR